MLITFHKYSYQQSTYQPCQGELLITFYVKILVFDKMSGLLDDGDNPFPPFNLHGLPLIPTEYVV